MQTAVESVDARTVLTGVSSIASPSEALPKSRSAARVAIVVTLLSRRAGHSALLARQKGQAETLGDEVQTLSAKAQNTTFWKE